MHFPPNISSRYFDLAGLEVAVKVLYTQKEAVY